MQVEFSRKFTSEPIFHTTYNNSKKIPHQSQDLKIISRYISFMAIATFKNTYVRTYKKLKICNTKQPSIMLISNH